MPITRGGFANLLTTKFQDVVFDVGKELPLEYIHVMKVTRMEINPTISLQVAGLQALYTKPEGTQFRNDQPVLGGTLSTVATPYGMIVEITKEMYRDGLYDVIQQIWKEMGRSARYVQDINAWSMFNNAFSNSFPGYDGVSLCNTNHPLLEPMPGTAVQANRGSPDVGLSITGVQNARFRFETRKNQRGLPSFMTPRRILIDPQNIYIAREVLGSSAKPYTADNEGNAVVADDIGWQVSHYFTSSTQWFMMASVRESDMEFMWRDKPEENSFDDPFTGNSAFTLYERFAYRFRTWQFSDGSTG